jgi:hypothetical protein
MKYVKTFEGYNRNVIEFSVNEDTGTFIMSKNDTITELIKEDLNNLLEIMNDDITKYKMVHENQTITAWKSNHFLVIQTEPKNVQFTQHVELDINEQNMLIDAIDELIDNTKN